MMIRAIAQFYLLLLIVTFYYVEGLVHQTFSRKLVKSQQPYALHNKSLMPSFGQKVIAQRKQQYLRDILGLGPTEIALTVVVALVLFGPETLKSLSKDVGRAAAELKEIPKTFKEGMDEGAQTSQVAKMKLLAAEKRKKRDEQLANKGKDEDEEEEEEESDA